MNELEQYLREKNFPVPFPKTQKPSLVDNSALPFTNRLHEISQITYAFTYASVPQFYFIDAPAGYGKTELLHELKSRFENEKPPWWCAYTAIREEATMFAIAESLAHELNVDITATDPTFPSGKRLGSAVHRQWDKTKRGLILLLDLDKKPVLSILDELMHNFIPSIKNTLVAFGGPTRPFRVVIAGRYIAAQLSEKEPPPATLPLDPFNYAVVRDSVSKYLPDDHNTDDVAAHLLYLAGGHPGCMVSILQKYKRGWTPSDLATCAERIWKDDDFLGSGIHREAQEIYDEIPCQNERLRDLIVRLSVFRYLDNFILGEFILPDVPAMSTPTTLSDSLKDTYLFRRQGRWIRDDIARRLLALRLRNTNTQKFIRLCEQAKNIYIRRFSSPKQYEPEISAMEYLFQCLQRHAGNIQTAEQRAAIRSSFWDENVPHVLKIYLNSGDSADTIQEKNALIDKIRGDWEFQFTVNYYLREEHYTDEKCQQLLEKIAAYNP